MTTAFSSNHFLCAESTPRRLPYKERFKREAIIIADTREQKPYLFEGHTVVSNALPAGDYSIQHFETVVALERKTLEDYLRSITGDRKRFMEEVQKLSEKYAFSAVVVEGSWSDILLGNYPRSQTISVDVIVGNTLSIQADYGVPVMWLDNRQAAQRWVLKYLERVWKKFKR